MTPTPLRGDRVKPESVNWLWRERIPRSMYSMVAGRPDQKKSLMAITIAADVTKAGGNVLWSGAERPPAIVDHPRFIAAGGVQSRIHYWRFALPASLEELSAQIVDKDIDLVVMDPASAHFGAIRSSDRIRDILNPLTEIIEQTGTAVLFVEHALKRVPTGAQPLSAIAGSSSGLPAACAMAFLFGDDPADENNSILACVKNNIRERPLAIRFQVDTEEVEGASDMPTLAYDQELIFDPMRLLTRESNGRVGRPNDRRAAASEWLENYLRAAGGGPVRASLVMEDAKQAGFTTRTMRRAAVDMEIIKSAASGPKVTWTLPDNLLGDGPTSSLDQGSCLEPPAERGRPRDVLAWIDYVEGEVGAGHPDMPAHDANVELEGLISDDEIANFLKGME